MKPLILRALAGEPIERPPVWMMRQAGRYLPEYRELKAKYDFLTLCKNPELAVEVTLQPIRRFRPDAAIIFADIMLPAESIGLEIAFNPGPSVANPIRTPADISALKVRSVEESVGYVFQALALAKKELIHFAPDPQFPSTGNDDITLLGFAGAPYTMACYLIDQGPYKHFQGTQVFAAEQPAAFHQFLALLADLTFEYLLGQYEHGAQAVQLFDTWGGNLSEREYRRYALPYVQSIISRLKAKGIPTVLYINGSSHLLQAMKDSGADCLSLDWRTDLAAAEELLGPEIALQGNFDPTLLYSTESEVAEATSVMLESLKRRSGYVANLGHGILQRTPVENARRFIETVKRGWL